MFDGNKLPDKRTAFQRLLWQGLGMAVFTLSIVHGAFAQKVTMEFDQSVDFSKYKTFAIRDAELNSKNPALNSDLVKKQIDADIKRDLQARGLTQVSGPSDLNVRYHFGAARKTQVETYPAGWYGLRSRGGSGSHTEGPPAIDPPQPSHPALDLRPLC